MSIGLCTLVTVIINVIPYADFEVCLSSGSLYAKLSFDIIADITNTFYLKEQTNKTLLTR